MICVHFFDGPLFCDTFGSAGRIQLVGFRFRLLDIRLQRRVCPFFLGQFQTGGGTVQAIFIFGGSCGFCCLFCFLFGRVFFFGILGPF